MNKNCVIIPNEWHVDIVTNEVLVIYATLQRYFNLNRKEFVGTINVIKDCLRYTKRSSVIINQIKTAINQLIEIGYLDVYTLSNERVNVSNIGNNETLVFKLVIPEEKYFKVYDYGIDSILNYLNGKTGKINKFAILRYYMAICRVTNNEEEFGFLTHRRVHNIVKKSETIRNYNNILSELSIIVYNNDYITQDNRNCSTYFGLYSSKDKFYKFLDYEVNRLKLIKK